MLLQIPFSGEFLVTLWAVQCFITIVNSFMWFQMRYLCKVLSTLFTLKGYLHCFILIFNFFNLFFTWMFAVWSKVLKLTQIHHENLFKISPLAWCVTISHSLHINDDNKKLMMPVYSMFCFCLIILMNNSKWFSWFT